MFQSTLVPAEKVFKIDVEESIVDAFTAYCDSKGMKNKVVGARVIDFFNNQPDAVKKYIAGLVDGTEGPAIEAFKRAIHLLATMPANQPAPQPERERLDGGVDKPGRKPGSKNSGVGRRREKRQDTASGSGR